MKKLGIMAGVLLLVLSIMVINVPAQESQQEQELKQTEQQSKQEYLTTMEAFWAEMEEDVDMLGQKAQEAGSDLKQEYDELAAEFGKSVESAKQKLMKLEDAEIWQDMQAETEQASAEVKQAYYKLKSAMLDTKEDYQAYLDMRIEELDQQIEALQNDMTRAGEEIETDMQDTMESLQQEQSRLQSEFNKLQEATEENWQELKNKKIEPALQEVEKAYGEAKAKLNDMLSQ